LETGAARGVAGATHPLSAAFALASASAMLLVLSTLIAPEAVACGVLVMVIASAALWRYITWRLNGYSGDALGAIQLIGEIGLYLGIVACP
ncbi:MAG: adenosylcobinamide-GDP ribazoletransferase, partial [Henriciella sp.]|uniref:adenosylcobinamide-GDP ribazoletransferase n=1 Tax=Henriciella sp. TaxID=1968823 RepID=UPI003C70E9DC